MSYDPKAGKTFLHPGRQANIIYNGEVMGYLGEIHPQVADNYGIGDKTYVAVLDMPVVVKYADFDRKFTGIARFPAVTRDLSMVVPQRDSGRRYRGYDRTARRQDSRELSALRCI